MSICPLCYYCAYAMPPCQTYHSEDEDGEGCLVDDVARCQMTWRGNMEHLYIYTDDVSGILLLYTVMYDDLTEIKRKHLDFKVLYWDVTM